MTDVAELAAGAVAWVLVIGGAVWAIQYWRDLRFRRTHREWRRIFLVAGRQARALEDVGYALALEAAKLGVAFEQADQARLASLGLRLVDTEEDRFRADLQRMNDRLGFSMRVPERTLRSVS